MFRLVSIAMLLAANDEVNGVLIRYDRFVKNSATPVERVGVTLTEPTPPTQQAEPAIVQEVSGEKRHSPVKVLLWCVHVGGCLQRCGCVLVYESCHVHMCTPNFVLHPSLRPPTLLWVRQQLLLMKPCSLTWEMR